VIKVSQRTEFLPLLKRRNPIESIDVMDFI